MKTIGLTGGIGSGKSTVAQFFKDGGVPVLDADSVVHHVYTPGTWAYGEIVKAFGEDVLSEDGTVNRKLLGELIFTNPAKRVQLERITHPAVEKTMRDFVKACGERNLSLCVIEAALIFEKNRGELFDHVVTVWATREDQIERITIRDGLSEEEAATRIDTQLPLEEKVKRSDFVVDNSGSLEDTKKQVRALIEMLGKQ